MLARVKSSCNLGINGHIIDVEADISGGLPSFDIVGLPDASVKEAKQRVNSAIKNSGFLLDNRKTTINLAPADVKKEGSGFDLAIAVSVLLAAERVFAPSVGEYILLGELSLGGELRGIDGVLPIVLAACEQGYKKFILPKENAFEASLAYGAEVFGAENFREVIMHLTNEKLIDITQTKIDDVFLAERKYDVDFSDVRGQESMKRAVEVAAAGGHNLLIIGSPGSGKTMIAQRIPTILPDLTIEEAIETTKVHSVAGLLRNSKPLVTTRPFRNPHHSTSTFSLVGGGTSPKPGEVSLAHNGVLFLDEFPEFKKDAIEIMRQPLEDGKVTISRVAGSMTYPSKTMLVAAMNPCRCGNYGDTNRKCTCTPYSISQYLSKISGPMLDRIDITVEAPAVDYRSLRARKGETSETIRKRVNTAREKQKERFKGTRINCNAQMSATDLEKYCILGENEQKMVEMAYEQMNLSVRGYSKIVKIARTIADLSNHENINEMDLAEAISYRRLEGKYWR